MPTRTRATASMAWRSPCKTSDACATNVRKASLGIAQRGFTVIELLVVVAMLAIMAGTAYSRLPLNPYTVWITQNQVLSDIRHARDDALTKGDHFRVDITDSTHYVTYRLQLVGAVWVPNGPAIRSATLQNGIVFTTGIGRQLEFTTRGLMLVPDAATTLTLYHSASSTTRTITIWPSGQVAPG